MKAKPICLLTVIDPDSKLPVELEIWKLETGAVVGLDASFLAEDLNPVSPYDRVINPDTQHLDLHQLQERQNYTLNIEIPDDGSEGPYLQDPWWIISGRRHGRDEDITHIIQATTRNDAEDSFAELCLGMDYLDTWRDLEDDRVYINSIIRCDSQPESLHQHY